MNDTVATDVATDAPASEKRSRGPSTSVLLNELLLGTLDLASITRDQAKRVYKAIPEDKREAYSALSDIIGEAGERGRVAFGPGMTRTFKVQEVKGKNFIRLPLDFLPESVEKVTAVCQEDGSVNVSAA